MCRHTYTQGNLNCVVFFSGESWTELFFRGKMNSYKCCSLTAVASKRQSGDRNLNNQGRTKNMSQYRVATTKSATFFRSCKDLLVKAWLDCENGAVYWFSGGILAYIIQIL